MDFLTDRTMNLTELAMDGLMARQKVIAANIANAETPGYQRKDVIFEDQLVKIMQQENLKENIKKSKLFRNASSGATHIYPWRQPRCEYKNRSGYSCKKFLRRFQTDGC